MSHFNPISVTVTKCLILDILQRMDVLLVVLDIENSTSDRVLLVGADVLQSPEAAQGIIT